MAMEKLEYWDTGGCAGISKKRGSCYFIPILIKCHFFFPLEPGILAVPGIRGGFKKGISIC